MFHLTVMRLRFLMLLLRRFRLAVMRLRFLMLLLRRFRLVVMRLRFLKLTTTFHRLTRFQKPEMMKFHLKAMMLKFGNQPKRMALKMMMLKSGNQMKACLPRIMLKFGKMTRIIQMKIRKNSISPLQTESNHSFIRIVPIQRIQIKKLHFSILLNLPRIWVKILIWKTNLKMI